MFNTFIKQTEVNSGGGIRISVYKQSFGPDGSLIAEQPHQITVGPFDDFDQIIEANNVSLVGMGYPAIDSAGLTLPLSLRAAAHANPLVQERMAIEAERTAAERRADEERTALAATEAEKAEADKAAAFTDAVAAEVAKQLAAKK